MHTPDGSTTGMSHLDCVYIVPSTLLRVVYFKKAATDLVRLGICVFCDCLINECEKIFEVRAFVDTEVRAI
jgi:hypothetical protein